MSQRPTVQELDAADMIAANPVSQYPGLLQPTWRMRARQKWDRIFLASTNRRILNAAIVIGVLTLFAKAVSTGKEVFVAASFGTSDALDAFLVAFVLPTFAINVIGGSIGAALIPTLVEVREKDGHGAAQHLFSEVLAFSMALLTFTALILAAAATFLIPLLSKGFSPQKIQLTMQLYFFLLPGILFAGLTMTCQAALNAGERFAFAALAPIVIPIAAVAALLMADERSGVEALALGTIVGMALELVISAYSLRKRGILVNPVWNGGSPAFRKAATQYYPAVVASGLMCSTALVDQAMAGMLSAGSVSALNYGNKIVALLLTVSATALSTALLPYLSKMAAISDWDGLKHTLRTYAKLVVILTLPIVVLGILYSEALIRVLFERGEFTSADTSLVANIQRMYLLQIPFYGVSILFVRVISSIQANHLLMWGTVISIIVNFVMNYVLMKEMGVAGIALSTTIVYAVASIFLGTVLWRKLKVLAG